MNNNLIKMNNKEFIEFIADLESEINIDFCYTTDNHEDDGAGEGWYSVKKTQFNDVRIILIGGYGHYTICIDYDEADIGEGDILDFIEEDLINYLDGEGLTDEIFVEIKN